MFNQFNHEKLMSIPVPQRIMAIIQLCLAFSLLLWLLGKPFFGEYFSLRSRMLPYEYVMGTSKHFEHLPTQERELIEADYRQLKAHAQRPASTKIEAGLRNLIQQVPPFEQAWIFFSIWIAIALLLNKEGARIAVWLLPVIVLAYAFDNQRSGKVLRDPDHHLFPSEQLITEKYLQEPLSPDLRKQRKQLEQGWQRYLIAYWSKGGSLADAEFNFTLARLKEFQGQPMAEWLYNFHEKQNPWVLLLYFAWNLLFAWVGGQMYSTSLKTPIPAK